MSDERNRVAAERILDAAGSLFAERGVRAVGMREVAEAAGCSRATLYRYFSDRGQLHLAFVQREAMRIGALIAGDLEERPDLDAAGLATEGVLAALRHVRAAPALVAWFRDDDAGRAAEIALGSTVPADLGAAVVPDPETAAWLVRVIVSLLTVPGGDEAAERRLVERFVAPVVADESRTRSGSEPA